MNSVYFEDGEYKTILIRGHGRGYISLSFDWEMLSQEEIDKKLRDGVKRLLDGRAIRTGLRPVKRILGVRPDGRMKIPTWGGPREYHGQEVTFQNYRIYYEI